MQTLEDWVNSPENKRVRELPLEELVTKDFFRDPLRTVKRNKNKFYAPADGTVLYTYENIKPDEKIVEVKGVNYTVRELLHDKDYDHNSLVIGIFLSYYDMHINRMPTDGYFSNERNTPPIKTHRTSMVALEQNLCDELRLDPNNMEYLFDNERVIVTIACPQIKSNYYLVQVADRDVDVISNWADHDYLIQGERIGIVRYGSQVDLVIPLTEQVKDFRFDILVKKLHHVLASEDAIIEVHPK